MKDSVVLWRICSDSSGHFPRVTKVRPEANANRAILLEAKEVIYLNLMIPNAMIKSIMKNEAGNVVEVRHFKLISVFHHTKAELST